MNTPFGWLNMFKTLSTDAVFGWIQEWVREESRNLLVGALATASNNIPYSRLVAIKEINAQGVVFFTQLGSQKVQQIADNPMVSITIFLPEHARQIIIAGKAMALSEQENQQYWKAYPKESQLRFIVYGPRSGEKIKDNSDLDELLNNYRQQYQNKSVEKPEAYIGYRIAIQELKLYQLNAQSISDSFILTPDDLNWKLSQLVP